MKKLTVILTSVILMIGYVYLNKNYTESEQITDKNTSNLYCPEYIPSLNVTATSNQNENEFNQIENSDWYTNAIKYIEADEYSISYSEDIKSYQSPNRANNIRFSYNNDGFTAKLLESEIPLFNVKDKMLRDEDKKYQKLEDWNIELKAEIEKFKTGIGKLETSGNRAWMDDDNLRIEYTNTKDGMRQDFIIKNKSGEEGTLELVINVRSNLTLNVSKDAVRFRSESGEDKMQYASLKAFDATGKTLDAYFEKKSEEQFAIVVDDGCAEYPVTIDPISDSPNWYSSFPEGIWNGKYAYSVSSAGDVNLDGYSDVIIGNYLYSNQGKAYLFYGSPSIPSTVPAWTYESGSANAKFGFSVSGSGDVNGDNYPDVIIGAPYYSNGEVKEGRAYVFYGSHSGLSSTPDWVYESDKESAEAGYAVSTAGDFNNDGYDDVIVGLPHYLLRENPSRYGRVYIFFGSAAGISNSPDVTWSTSFSDAPQGMGFSVACAGDINGDGFSDVIFGDPYFMTMSLENNNSFIAPGIAYVKYGYSNPPGSSWAALGKQEAAYFGYSVSSAGDVNNDGYDDVIIGAPVNYGQGKTYVYLGSPSGLSSNPDWEKTETGYGFGRSVASGDFNSDGYSDVIIGAHLTIDDPILNDNNSGEYLNDTNQTTAYVYYGSQTGLKDNYSWRYDFSSGTVRAYTICVSPAGDVNGDGYCDILIGTLRYNEGVPFDAALMFYGGYTVSNISPCWSKEGGYVVSGAGDLNNDGFDDVIIGNPNFSNDLTNEGIVYAYHGSSSGLPGYPNWSSKGNMENAYFGYSVSGAGDVNSDGYSDVVIGAPGVGKAFVFYGSNSGLLVIPNWTGNTYEDDKKFGISVSNAGDVNGDGYDDIVIGTEPYQNYNGHNTGAFVYAGSASGITGQTPLWTATSEEASNDLGRVVSSAGDVNNDGYDDILVSDRSLNKVYAYYGSANRGIYDPADWYGSEYSIWFGFNVSDAGDVNGDGYGDIIIGSIGTFNPYTINGFVYYGSATGLPATCNWFVELPIIETIVSSAGDFNNDGYDDVIIGEERSGEDPGAYMFFGSSSGLHNSCDLTFNISGTTLSSAGDVNGDNFDDIIIGSIYPNWAALFCGTGYNASYFQMTPKLVTQIVNKEVCISAIVKDQQQVPMRGVEVKFIVKGANPDSVSLITDNQGSVKYCYNGTNHGIDTILGKTGNMTDKTIAVWDFPYPVEMLSFTSSANERNVTLNWSTATELNNSGFDIERAVENSEWKNIGFVNGNGTTNEPSQYSFTDKNLQSGKYKYRLKQIDFNGNFEYFELAEEVNIGIPDKYELSQNYPNPFNPVTTINYDIPKVIIVTIKIYDILGREVKTLVNEMKTAGYYKLQFNASDFASGAYFYRMTAGDFTSVKKFVVLK